MHFLNAFKEQQYTDFYSEHESVLYEYLIGPNTPT